MTELKPLQSIQEPLEVGLKVVLAVHLAYLVMTPIAYSQYSKLPPDQMYLETFLWSDNIMMVLEILTAIVSVGAIVLYFIWIHRATKNLRALTGYPMTQTPGWAVGWYFVPIAFLFKPYRGMSDIWGAVGVSGGNGIRIVWWLTLLASSFVSGMLQPDNLDVTVAEAQAFTIPDMVGAAGVIALAMLTLAVVSRVGAAYARNVTEWRGQQPSVPAGWYDDPSGAEALRYWDGTSWTDDLHPRGADTTPVTSSG